MHLVLKKGTKLNSLKDLNGMKVGVAAAGSGTQVSVRMILKHYDIKANDAESNLNLFYTIILKFLSVYESEPHVSCAFFDIQCFSIEKSIFYLSGENQGF